MSRAFVKETAESAPPPERMVEEGPNLVTPEGLAQIEGHVARLEAELAKLARRAGAPEDALASETLARDLRYWVHQRASAEIVRSPSTASRSPSPANAGENHIIMFGSRVVIARKGREQSFRIVGVDEADPARGLISFRSPLADAILGARAGEVVEADGPLGEIEIVRVEN
jgi:transcription elongation GreA/GreB family factor